MEWIIVGIGILAAAAVFVGYEIWENHRLITEEYVCVSDGLPEEFDGFCFVFLTDLHNNHFGKENETLLKAIRMAEPEVVLIGGDMIVSRQPDGDETAKNLLLQIASEYPVYYTFGNHESNRSRAGKEGAVSMFRYEQELSEAGIRFLHNDTAFLMRGESRIAVSGYEPADMYYKRGRICPMEEGVVEQAVSKSDMYTILLAHTPFYFERYEEWGADLVLSGHVHGGMVKLPLIGGLASPQYTLFPRYDSGIYTKNQTTMLLSRGLGLHTFPIRIWNRPELSAVTLKKG